MPDQFSRTCLMLGKENMQRLQHARVAVFGIGGVGGYVVEGLVRSGIGTFDLIDHDQICLSNLNRQIIATRKTIGKYKVDVAKERILEINPEASHLRQIICTKAEEVSLFCNLVSRQSSSRDFNHRTYFIL